jgi:DNA-binding response OmpR family regulator
MTASPRILIVDDEAETVGLLQEYFVKAGYRVHVAMNGGDALILAQHEPPDVVLLDLAMPGMDGMQVLQRLRATYAAIPVVIATANTDVALARHTLAMGAFDYVTKPFDLAYLERVVTVALAHGSDGKSEGLAT